MGDLQKINRVKDFERQSHSMSVTRVVVKRVLAGTGSRVVGYTFRTPSHVRQLQRIGCIPSISKCRWNSTTVQENDSTHSPPFPLPVSLFS